MAQLAGRRAVAHLEGAAVVSWWDSIFGYPDRPNNQRQPSSRGSMLGLAYQGLPDAKASIDNRRGGDPYSDYKGWIQSGMPSSPEAHTAMNEYVSPEAWMGKKVGWSDPMLTAGGTLSLGATEPGDVDPYKPSYPMSAKIRPRLGVAPYRPSPVGRDEYGDEIGPMGPNLPRGPVGTSRDPEMPYMGAHLPFAPGDPGWTPPPSPSGPHNRAGDVARPGYDSPVLPMDIRGLTLNSNPWGY